MIGLFAVRARLLAGALFLTFLVAGLGANPSAAGIAQAQTVAQKIAASEGLLDINTATAAQLKALPGMGDTYVRRLVAGRPYSAKSQLTTRGIIPATEYEEIKPLIIAHRAKH